jgi:hypothetical protein
VTASRIFGQGRAAVASAIRQANVVDIPLGVDRARFSLPVRTDVRPGEVVMLMRLLLLLTSAFMMMEASWVLVDGIDRRDERI